MENELETFVNQYDAFIDATDDARELAESDRDYRDHKQWTDEESSKITDRGQAPVVINRIAPKVDSLLGIVTSTRSDPKAFPRTPSHEKASESITDAIRYVVENNDFDSQELDAAENLFVEGVESGIVEVDKNLDIKIRQIPWDRIYYDPHSRKRDFSDAKYKGIVVWLDKGDAEEMFKEDLTDLFNIGQGIDTDTHEDKPNWIDRKRKRLKVCQHYYLHKGVWHLVFFNKHRIVRDAEPSPDLDDDGEPMCPIELQSAYIDREGNRYGLVRALKWVQDEINHRRSKMLYLLSVRQTAAEEGAIPDVPTMKEQLARPHGHVKLAPNALRDRKFQILPTGDMADGQFTLLQEAKGEIDAVGTNAALVGKEDRDLSGRALQARQQGGLLELSRMLDGHRSWKKRIYRQVWSRIKQYWDKEKWIRVTDDANSINWVGLNVPVNQLELAVEQQTGLDVNVIKQQFGKEISQAVLQNPLAGEVVEIRNEVPKLDMDIIIEEGPDAITIQQEQFEQITALAERYGPDRVPFELIIELSSLRDKDKILERLEQQSQLIAQQQAQTSELATAQAVADLENKQASTQKAKMDAAKSEQEAVQKAIENELLRLNPRPVSSVAV